MTAAFELEATTWGDMVTIKQGRYVAKEDVAEARTNATPVPVVGANGVLGYVASASYLRRVPLVTCRGSNCGLIQYPGEPVWVSNNAMGLDAGGQIANDLVYYLALATNFDDVVSGSAQPQITAGPLKAKRVLVPPRGHWKSIAATLGALDDKIESNRRANQLALSLAESHVVKAVSMRPASPYQRHMSVRMGSAFKGGAFSKPGVGRPLLRIRDLKTFESQVWTTESRPDETVIRPGDVVVGMDAEFRATLWLGAESVLNQRVCTFAPHAGVGRAFVLNALAPELALQEQAKTGTTVIHLNKADINRFEVPDLSDAEHRALAELTEPLIDNVVARAAENHTLTELRQTLLPELLSGRIRVPEAANAITHELPELEDA